MNLRWLVIERAYKTWDDRFKEYNYHLSKEPPVLQYETEDNNWVIIPVVYERVSDELEERS